jgi:2-polyprenyl-3-methyl-5-hydroxy-6-metoxy-1,4-benzoquinol methylase
MAPYHGGKMKYNLIKDPLGYYRCDPLPTEAELESLYVRSFYTSEKPDYIGRQEEDIRWWNAMYDDRLTVISEVYRTINDTVWPLILDIGCGGGFFLRRAYELGWVGVGVEPSTKAIEYARDKTRLLGGCVFYESKLENVKETRFWGIHMCEVLEHLRNPLQMLKDAYDKLMVGGCICVVVPNEKISKWYSSTNGCEGELEYPHVFQPPQHINYFDFDSLESLMKEAGFEIYERSAMYPMEACLKAGYDYVDDPTMGRLCHQMRKNFDLAMTPEERRTFYAGLAKNNLGRECVIYAIKK